jgi:hypothetical protein
MDMKIIKFNKMMMKQENDKIYDVNPKHEKFTMQ